MSRKKLIRFAEIRSFSNVVESPDGEKYKGRWSSDFFHNNQPLVLELACGKGEYSVAIGRMYSEVNVLGIDRKGERIWRGAKNALEENLLTVGFLRGDIEKLDSDFAEGEIAELFLIFPDPHPKDAHEHRRLTAAKFLALYARLLSAHGSLHLKTDDIPLARFSRDSLLHAGWTVKVYSEDIDQDRTNGNITNTADTLLPIADLLNVSTTFEVRKRAEGRTICYLRAQPPR